MLHYGYKYHLEVALVSENGAIKTLPLSDTTYITVSRSYHNPEISKLKCYARKNRGRQLISDCSVDEKVEPTNFSGSSKYSMFRL